MKKLIIIALAITFSSCATVLGGKITTDQTRIPLRAEQQRKLRMGYVMADFFLCLPCFIVDFGTGAIYKPEPNK